MMSATALSADPHSLESELDQTLWALYEIGDWSTATSVSEYLRDKAHLGVSRQRAKSELDRAVKASLATHDQVGRKAKGTRRYQILKQGIDRVTSSERGCIYVEPSSAYSGIRGVEALIASLKGELRICDPYLDKSSLDYFAQQMAATSIRLLSQPIQKPGPFRRDLKALQSEFSTQLQVREHPKGTLHDRYIVHDEGMIILGTSLNGLGKKQSMVWESGTNLRDTIIAAFDQFWANSTDFV